MEQGTSTLGRLAALLGAALGVALLGPREGVLPSERVRPPTLE